MTVQEQLEKMLFERGLPKSAAREIIERVKCNDTDGIMKERWSDCVEDYPEPIPFRIVDINDPTSRIGVD